MTRFLKMPFPGAGLATAETATTTSALRRGRQMYVKQAHRDRLRVGRTRGPERPVRASLLPREAPPAPTWVCKLAEKMHRTQRRSTVTISEDRTIEVLAVVAETVVVERRYSLNLFQA
jgi:hypothetical protein